MITIKYYITHIVSYEDILNPNMDFTNEITEPILYDSIDNALDVVYDNLISQISIPGFLNRNDLNSNVCKCDRDGCVSFTIKNYKNGFVLETNKSNTITKEYFLINKIDDKDIAYLILETIEGDYFTVDELISNSFINSLDKANKELFDLQNTNKYADYRIDIVDMSKLKESTFYKGQFHRKLEKNLITKDFFDTYFN